MSMREALIVVNELRARGVLKDYAITGAVAALAYVEPTMTQDLDVLVSLADFEERSGLLLLTPIETALAQMGYTRRGELGIIVEGWPIEFLPVASDLDAESLREAVDIDLGGTPPVAVRVLRPEHIVAKAVSVGRLKDLARIEVFLDQAELDVAALRDIVNRHNLTQAWKAFCMKSGRPDILALE